MWERQQVRTRQVLVHKNVVMKDVLVLGGGLPGMRNTICWLCLLQGNPSACMQLLMRGSSLNPADPALYQARGVVEKEWRHYDAARSLFKQGLAVDPCHLYLWQVSNKGIKQ
jgi:hypothetical protein